jgi:hypothetical protein
MIAVNMPYESGSDRSRLFEWRSVPFMISSGLSATRTELGQYPSPVEAPGKALYERRVNSPNFPEADFQFSRRDSSPRRSFRRSLYAHHGLAENESIGGCFSAV